MVIFFDGPIPDVTDGTDEYFLFQCSCGLLKGFVRIKEKKK